jgi:hypothetical protein
LTAIPLEIRKVKTLAECGGIGGVDNTSSFSWRLISILFFYDSDFPDMFCGVKQASVIKTQRRLLLTF